MSQDRREDADGRNQADLEFVVCCVVSVRNRIKRKEKEKKKKKGREKKGAREEGRKKKRRSDTRSIPESKFNLFPINFYVSHGVFKNSGYIALAKTKKREGLREGRNIEEGSSPLGTRPLRK